MRPKQKGLGLGRGSRLVRRHKLGRGLENLQIRAADWQVTPRGAVLRAPGGERAARPLEKALAQAQLRRSLPRAAIAGGVPQHHVAAVHLGGGRGCAATRAAATAPASASASGLGSAAVGRLGVLVPQPVPEGCGRWIVEAGESLTGEYGEVRGRVRAYNSSPVRGSTVARVTLDVELGYTLLTHAEGGEG